VEEEPIKNESLSVKTSRNTIWNIGGFLFSLVITFITIPLFISLLGDENYGLFVLFQSVMVSFSLIGLGVAPATVKYVAESIGRGDYGRANQFINTTLCFNLLVGMVGFIAIILLADPLAHKILKIPIESQITVQKCFYWMATGWFVAQIAGTLKGIPTAFQNFKFVAIGTSFFFGLMALVGLTVLRTGGNLVNLVQSNAAVLTISIIGWWFLARRVFPELQIRTKFDRCLFKKTISYGSWQTVADIGGMMYHWLDRVIIGIFLPPAAIGYYNVPVTLCSKGHTGLSQIGTVFFPLISYLQGKNEKKKIYKYFINGSWIIGLFSAGIYIPLLIFGKTFLELWVGHGFAEKNCSLFSILIIAFFFLSTGIIRYMFMAGIDKVRWNVLAAWIAGVIGLGVNIILIPKFGLAGAGFGYLSSSVSGITIAIIIKTKFFADKSWFEYLYHTYGPLIVGTIILFLSYTFLSSREIKSWFNFLIYYLTFASFTMGVIVVSDIIMMGGEKIKFLKKVTKIFLGKSSF